MAGDVRHRVDMCSGRCAHARVAAMNWRNFLIESAASVLTLTGIAVGSTTVVGSCFYLSSLVFWFWISFRKELWGIMPLNVATAVISAINLWRAL